MLFVLSENRNLDLFCSHTIYESFHIHECTYSLHEYITECDVLPSDGGDRRLIEHSSRTHRVSGDLRQTATDPLLLTTHSPGQR